MCKDSDRKSSCRSLAAVQQIKVFVSIHNKICRSDVYASGRQWKSHFNSMIKLNQSA